MSWLRYRLDHKLLIGPPGIQANNLYSIWYKFKQLQCKTFKKIKRNISTKI